MAPETRMKVLRDMHPESRKKWQLDNVISDPWEEKPDPNRPVSVPTEREVEMMLEACEAGRQATLQEDLRKPGQEERYPLETFDPERRSERRRKVNLPVVLGLVAANPRVRDSDQPIFRGIAENISLRGVKILLEAASSRQLAPGARLSVAIRLPRPLPIFTSIAVIMHVARARDGREKASLGAVFETLTSDQGSLLGRFVESQVQDDPATPSPPDGRP